MGTSNDESSVYVIDEVLDTEELLSLYHNLQATPKWTLSRGSVSAAIPVAPFGSFPGLVVEDEGEVCDEYLSGYFQCLTYRVRSLVREQHGLQLPQRIKRIHLGAKNSFSKTSLHKDCEREDAWTILGFLNPVWKSKDGGQLKVENREIEYESGRFVIFPSHRLHDGGFVKNETLSYWRITLNVILVPEKDAEN